MRAFFGAITDFESCRIGNTDGDSRGIRPDPRYHAVDGHAVRAKSAEADHRAACAKVTFNAFEEQMKC